MTVDEIKLLIKDAWVKANDSMDKLQEVIDELAEREIALDKEEEEILYQVGEVFDEIESAIVPLEEFIDMENI